MAVFVQAATPDSDERPTRVHRPPILLAMPSWFGTLAAARELGRRGIDVHVAGSESIRLAGWSRFVQRSFSTPPESDLARQRDWLLDYGRRHPQTVLCPANDDFCFLYSLNAKELREYFLCASPGLGVLRELLDKARLHQNAARAGIATPRTAFPVDGANAAALSSGLSFPVLIKQRTQVFSRTSHKGTPVATPSEIPRAYDLFHRRNGFAPEVLARWPGVDMPMLQEYLPSGSSRIHCVAGFLAPGGGRWAMRASTKVLSHPRYLGIGLMFEAAELDPELAGRILQLCRSVGFHGLFQCEFLEIEGERLLIDFNPRFYNYMAFDHARGLPQAYLAYLLAIGALGELDRALERAAVEPQETRRTLYHYGTGSFIQLTVERLFRVVPRGEKARWARWRATAAATVDPVWAADDRRPWLADLLRQGWRLIRHPRSFFRSNTRRPL